MLIPMVLQQITAVKWTSCNGLFRLWKADSRVQNHCRARDRVTDHALRRTIVTDAQWASA